jgi:hypothetical protein
MARDQTSCGLIQKSAVANKQKEDEIKIPSPTVKKIKMTYFLINVSE